jgi:hypothetical protein
MHCICYIILRHSAAEHRASTRILHRTLFLASLLISAQVFLTTLSSSSTFLRHVFLGLPLPRLPWWFHSRGLPGYVVRRFPQCMAQPSLLAFPDPQIYSWLLRTLPQLIVRYLLYMLAPLYSHYCNHTCSSLQGSIIREK